MVNLFVSVYQFFKTRKTLFFVFLISVFFILGYIASKIKFEEDISKLIPADENAKIVQKVLKNVNFSDKIIINISTSEEENLTNLEIYADSLNLLLQSISAIAKIQAKFEDDKMMELVNFTSSHLPLYLDQNDYKKIDSLLRPENVSAQIENVFHSIVSPSGFVTTNMLRSDPFGLDFMALMKFQELHSNDGFQIQNGYLTHESNQSILVFVTPEKGTNETSENSFLVEEIEKVVKNLNTNFKNEKVKAEYFGATPISVANANRIKSDIILTLSLSFVLLFLLFIYFYRKLYIPLIILVPAILGSLLGVVLLYFVEGTISAISIGIGSVLLGLTLDYSLHILSHYRSTGDISKLFKSTVKPLMICAAFTAADFLCLLFLKSDVLKDLGLFAAVSVLGAAFFALIFIPQVYHPEKSTQSPKNTWIDRLASYDFSRNKLFLFGSIGLIFISAFTFQKVGFDNDLNKLNYMPDNFQLAEKNLNKLTNYSEKSIYLAAYGKTEKEALEANSKLYHQLKSAKRDNEILNFSSIGGIVLTPEEQSEKIKIWQAYWTIEKKEKLKSQLISEGKKLGFKPTTFEPFFSRLEQTYKVDNLTEDPVLLALFLDEFIKKEKGFVTITSTLKTQKSEIEKVLFSFSNERNILVIDRKKLQETFLSNLESDFNHLFFISSIVVFVVLFFYFGSLELTLITNIPIFAGWFVTLGMMGLFGLNFNAFNIIITTLIFGLGVDYSIFITRGLIEKYTYGTEEMPAFKSGIIMSALATILCFGVLVFARHPAIYSISWIPIIGLSVVVLMSFTIQPWLFRFYIQKPQDKGNTPRTLKNVLFTIFTFGYFFIAGFLLNLFAQILLPLFPASKKKKFSVFHKTMRNYFWLLMYGTPHIPIRKIGNENLDLSEPKILIANHTSQLDTPTLGMLHDQLIFMVNNRVLNSKFFGKSIQMAGFYSSNGNHERETKSLEEKVKQGYSIIIFPEGTRSTTSVIQRFHKGAFYLSEKLKLDIQPVLIRGNSDLLPKNDNVLKSGKLTLEFLPVIRYNDGEFGNNYSEKTKNISTYFRSQLIELKRKEEDENYFKSKLSYNFIFKPSKIRKEVKAEFKAFKSTYHKILSVLPVKGKILHLNSGYGVLGFLLVYDSALRKVIGIENNKEKVKISNNTFTTNRFPVKFYENFRKNQDDFGYLILSPPSEGAEFQNLVNLENWELIFSEKGILIYKNAGGI